MTAPMVDYKIHWLKMMSVPESQAVVGRHDGINGRDKSLLMQIDAAVLAAYDLPQRLEKQLLDYFRDADRPLAHAWQHWDVNYPLPGLTLAERVSHRLDTTQRRIQDVFQPLPGKEADLLRTYGT